MSTKSNIVCSLYESCQNKTKGTPSCCFFTDERASCPKESKGCYMIKEKI